MKNGLDSFSSFTCELVVQDANYTYLLCFSDVFLVVASHLYLWYTLSITVTLLPRHAVYNTAQLAAKHIH